jgi:polyisoprenoid-binding protein YceI
MLRQITLTVAIAAVFTTPALSQGTVMTVRPESRVTLAGSSNVNRWACRTAQFTTAANEQITKVLIPATDVVVNIPVRSLDCGHGRMNADLYEALRADLFPSIRFTLASYEMGETTTDGTITATATGDLTVAGQARRVTIPISVRRHAAGVRGTATLSLRMTDFDVKPPVALLGLIRARNEIQVSFDVLLDTHIVVALTPR